MKCCKIFNFSSLILQLPITNNIFRSENTEIRSENVENRNLNFKSFSDRKIRKKKPEDRKFSIFGAVRKIVFRRKIDPWSTYVCEHLIYIMCHMSTVRPMSVCGIFSSVHICTLRPEVARRLIITVRHDMHA